MGTPTTALTRMRRRRKRQNQGERGNEPQSKRRDDGANSRNELR
jgi:hypothetical protein